MASRSVNKVLLLGHLGKDAEGKFLPSGVHVAKFSVATSRRWKDKGSDEWKEETEWTNVSLWRSENLVPYLTKGKQVYVEGRLQTRNYEDKEGQKRYSTEVVADEVILVGGGGGEKQDGGGLVSQPRGAQQAKQTSPMELTDDDIPF
jgi:single-strand DNA-binding protein